MSFGNVESSHGGQTMTQTASAFSKPQWSPHSYQITAIKMLLMQGSVALFLDPGLGKTSICLAGFKILKARQFAKKMLIIAPLRPCYKVWPDEIKKWTDFQGLTYTVLHGKDKEKNLQSDVDLYIINPEGLQWLYAAERKRPQFDILCVDESSKFKDSQTQRFKLLKPYIGLFSRKWILTGTPVPNGLMDLFGQIYILDQGASLGRYITHYRREFFDQSGFGGYSYTPKHDAFDRIVDRIKPLILRLSAEDHLAMPKLVHQAITVDLPPAALELYRNVEDAFYAALEGGKIVAANAAVAGGKCRQIANGAVYGKDDDSRAVIGSNPPWFPVHDAKLDALENLLEELGGKPVLIFYEFEHDKERILRRFPEAITVSGVTPKRLDEIINDFNAGKIRILLGHPASMGHGLNMQGACHHAIWFGITWNLDYFIQAIARIYRQGQKATTVFIYLLVAAKTLDERVVKVLTAKDKDEKALLTALGDRE